MNKNLENGVIKSLPRVWTQENINELLQLKADGLNNHQIAKKIDRTEVSVSVKLKRLTKSNDTYNDKHRADKYLYNEKFLHLIQPKKVLDVYAGNSFYKRFDDFSLVDNDKDKSFNCAFSLDAFKLLCLLNYNNKSYDIVDLDPYGSAVDCFDLSIKLANKGLVITLGELGHKRFKRLDFVKRWYGINNLEDFNVDFIIDKLRQRARCYKRELEPVFVREYYQIARVWFKVNNIKITEQWERKEVNGK